MTCGTPISGSRVISAHRQGRPLGLRRNVCLVASETKQDVLNDIARLIGRKPRAVSRGSTEPRAVYEDVVASLGLQVPAGLTKPRLAGAIARAGGEVWDDSCHSDSTPSGGGGTITLTGDRRVREAVRRLVARARPAPTQPVLADVTQQPSAGLAEGEGNLVAEEAADYGSLGDVQWEPVTALDTEIREGGFRVASDGVQQRELVNAALRGHALTVRRLKSAVEATGARTTQGRRSVDLRADWPDSFQLLAEVKTVPSNLVGRVRLGMAQLFEYRYRAGLPAATVLALVFDRPPAGPAWLTKFVTDDRHVNMVWWDGGFFVVGPEAEELARRIENAARARPS